MDAWAAQIQAAFNIIFNPSLKAASPIKYLHRAGLVLICQWVLTPMEFSEEPCHSRVRGSEKSLNLPGISQESSCKSYGGTQLLAKLRSSSQHLRRSFPQDVWSRWFNHFKFLVLAICLQHMTSLLTTTTTGTFHNPTEQHMYPTLLTESRLSPSVLSWGNLSVSLICNQRELQHNPVYLPTARRARAALSGHACSSTLIQSISGGQCIHSTLQGHLSELHILPQWTIHCSKGINPWQACLPTPYRDPSRDLPSRLRENITGL